MANIFILGWITSLFFCYKFFILPVLSPLSKIPNAHFTTPFSNAWILWQRYCSTETRAIHDSHRRLGPIVRLGPTEVSVNSLEGIRAIYGDNLDKHEWYCGAFENYGYAIKTFRLDSDHTNASKNAKYVFDGPPKTPHGEEAHARKLIQQINPAMFTRYP
jgi:hypothetical protein